MLLGWFIVFAILFAACLAVFITIMILQPKQEVVPPATPVFNPIPQFSSGLQQSFEQSQNFANAQGTILISEDTKPLMATTPMDSEVQPCFVFYNPFATGSQTFPVAAGFTFAVTNPITIVALQIIDQLLSSSQTSVGIYDVQLTTLLCSARVSKVNDFVSQGFRTHPLGLSAQTTLAPGRLYACVGVANIDDTLSFTENYVFTTSTILMDPALDTQQLGVGSVGTVASNVLALPTDFQPRPLSSPFASFAFVEPQLVTNVWQVDTQYARFPPSYVYGLNVTTPNANQVTVSPGVCNSSSTHSNIIIPTTALTLNVQGLESNTLYAVYVGDDEPTGNNTKVFLSKNFLETPDLSPDRQRRIGWVQTKFLTTDLVLVNQLGTGTSRITYYQEPIPQVLFLNVTVRDGFRGQFTFNSLPPTMTQVSLQFEANMSSFGSFWSMDINGVPVTFFDQSFQVQTVTVPTVQTTPFVMTSVVHYASGVPLTFASLTVTVLSFTEDL